MNRNRHEEKMRRRADRMAAREARPMKTRDEVYVTDRGKKYHDHWCDAINGAWLSGAGRIDVVPRGEVVNERESCGLCAQFGGGDGRDS